MRRTLLALALALTLGEVSAARLEAWVTSAELPPLTVDTSVEVLDRHGDLLRAYTVDDGRWRLAVTADQVDPGFTRMLIAYEDKRFHRHRGVDPIAMTRAVAQALWHGRVVSGGSTLTMQVARLLEDGPTGRWDGKLRQIRVALALERRLSKEDILTLYLNRAPYGGNLEGIRAATRAYFGKDPRRLTPAEAALVVALPQSPETRRPDRFPTNAQAARARVLARMEAAGVISGETLVTARRDPVPTRRIPLPNLAPHLADRALAEAPGLAAHSLTLDGDLQTRLEALAARAAADHGAKLSIALMVADHRSGEVLASVGSAGYRADTRQGFVDMTRALRSPGSTLKPLVYGIAFDDGLAHPETLIEDRPTRFGSYAPENFDGAYRGTIKVRDALTQSLNIPVVALTQAIGPARLMAHLRRAGVRAQLPGQAPAGLAVALGGIGVTLEDLTALYASFADDGRAVALSHRIGAPRSVGAKVLSPEAAWQVGHILSDMPAPPNAPRNRLAYKTGTSYGHRDTWAIGFDGAHVVSVWMGRADGTPVPGAFGADLAAPILFEAFARLKPTLDRLAPPPPATLLLSHAALPEQLRHFQPRDAVFAVHNRPELAFPPNGAVVATQGAALVARVDQGLPPFTWLANGTPVLVGSMSRQAVLPLAAPGHVTLSVIDATGQAARAQIELQ
ncbi:penicillin-binding protein 1C [Aliiroseovarius subalbicans]|uniref:penicillin-binding protein 1C n=1 Tax=Aliiroseovarius subalbicans TaxID=2925840 RepID=UPI001F5AFF81|nr:penicillin-binding protein 1C [Aliiroseovarius subalbicans]MCI2399781.1 penicillin-binding protein 1C [Aliiroseovarius subalbicans]